MKIAIIGAGAIGSVVAGYLAEAGADVCLVGRADQVNALKAQGLRIQGARGEKMIPLNAMTRLDKEYDLAIFTVKTQDVEEAYQDNHNFLDNALILTTQNGVQSDNILSSHFESDQIISSIVMFGATYMKPGEVTFNFEGDWIIGRPFMSNDLAVQEVAAILKKAFPVVVSDDIVGMKWLKLFVNFNNCLPALIGRSMQETFADMGFCKLSILLLKEGVDIIKQSGITLTSLPQFPSDRVFGLTAMPLGQAAGIINKTLTTLSKEPLYGSILQSIMRKKTSEIDYINGEVVALAKQSHLSAPLNRKVVDLVHQVENSGKFFDSSFIKKEFQVN